VKGRTKVNNDDFDFLSEFIPEHTVSFNRGQDEIGCSSIAVGIGIVITILYIVFEIVVRILTN
jgi:hypothetical protein